jgi:hypothetical protein
MASRIRVVVSGQVRRHRPWVRLPCRRRWRPTAQSFGAPSQPSCGLSHTILATQAVTSSELRSNRGLRKPSVPEIRRVRPTLSEPGADQTRTKHATTLISVPKEVHRAREGSPSRETSTTKRISGLFPCQERAIKTGVLAGQPMDKTQQTQGLFVVGPTGLEPVASSVSGKRSSRTELRAPIVVCFVC